MQIQFHQVDQFNHFNSRYVSGMYRSNTDSTLHSHRRMLEAQEESEKTEAVRVTISGEAMALARQAKAVERLEQFMNAREEKAEEANTPGQEDGSEEKVQLTDEELYEELLKQVEIWGDKSYSLLHDYDHKETAEMAEKRAATLHEMQKLAEMQKSQISKLQKDAQKAAETAAMQQEEISKKNSELIMMIESFEDQNEEDDKAAKSTDGRDDTEKKDAGSTGSLMEGKFGAQAVKGEMGFLNTINGMDASSTYRNNISDHSINAVETERKNIYRANDAENFTIKEKMAAMEDFVCTLANNEEVENSFKIRIKMEKDPEAKKKLEAKMEYFKNLPMKNVYERYLKEDREFALQERITARDLRIAHLGDQHFDLAQQQKKELQSLFDEDDIMRTQGQSSITSRMEDVAKRLQDKLDERDHIDEDTTPEEEIREEAEKDKLEKEEADQKDETDESVKNPSQEDAESVYAAGTFWKNAFDTMDWLNSVKKVKIMSDIAV